MLTITRSAADKFAVTCGFMEMDNVSYIHLFTYINPLRLPMARMPEEASLRSLRNSTEAVHRQAIEFGIALYGEVFVLLHARKMWMFAHRVRSASVFHASAV